MSTAVAAEDHLGPTRECDNLRCHAPVVDALAIGAGGHKKVILNPYPTTWVNGARFRLSVLQFHDQRPHVVQMRVVNQAFGIKTMFADHRTTCAGGSGVRTRSKEAER